MLRNYVVIGEDQKENGYYRIPYDKLMEQATSSNEKEYIDFLRKTSIIRRRSAFNTVGVFLCGCGHWEMLQFSTNDEYRPVFSEVERIEKESLERKCTMCVCGDSWKKAGVKIRRPMGRDEVKC